MDRITTYDALLTYTRSLQPGSTLTIGTDAVSPALLSTLQDLALAIPLTVASVSESTTPPSIKVAGTATLLGLAATTTTLTFAPPPEGSLDGPFYMTVEGSPAGDTEWTLLDAFRLDGISLHFTPNTELGIYDARLDCTMVVGSSRALSIPVAIDLPSYPGLDWSVTGSFAQQPLSADAFAALAGGITLSSYLPTPLDTLSRFGLTSVELGFNPGEGRFGYVSFAVAYTEAWSVLNIIDVPPLGVTLRFMVDFVDAGQSYVELQALFDIATVPVDIGAHFAPDDFYVWGRLQDGKTVAIAAVFDHFHVTLPAGFPAIEIDRLGLTANISTSTYAFDFVAQIDAGSLLRIDDLTAKVNVQAAMAGRPNTVVDAVFSGTIVLSEDASVFLGATYDGAGGGLTLKGEATNLVIGVLIDYVAHRFGITAIPEPIRSLVLKTLKVEYNTATSDFRFLCVGDFTVDTTPVELTFSIEVTHPSNARAFLRGAVPGKDGYSATFGGSVTFDDVTFDIRFNTTDTQQSIFVADYVDKSSDGHVTLHNLVSGVSTDIAALIPQDLSIRIDVLKFAYLKDTAGQRTFLFGVELGANISLDDIPLLGDALPEDATVAFHGLQFTYASRTLTKPQAGDINALLPAGVGKLPVEGFDEGILVLAQLQLGNTKKDVSLPIPMGSKASLAQPGTRLTAPAKAAPASLTINVQKQFGPLAVQKLGLLYADQVLYVTGDIELSANVLSLGLIGLGIGSTITHFSPAVTLSGLTVTMSDGPLEIRGGLLGTIDPLDFYGALSITVPSMSIGALGGYAQPTGGDPSFFLYATVNRPLFGYPFFFVDGLAAGFGFNRDLVLPDIDGVAAFPLVAWAMGENPPVADPSGNIGSQINQVVTTLGTLIPPRTGQYWVAAGLKFSSFTILRSFALITVSFGTEFKVALLGLTRASLPPNTAAIPPIAYVEMALRAVFAPNDGILQVAAKLTPASYLFTGACHLTGGFAYYTWFKDDPSGDPTSYHAGDFVVTLGGYHPAFVRPSYFPVEPLLGFNWKVDDHTSIKGGIYFALTPSIMMAGGRLEAVWQSGDLKAWFIAYADFLLSWKPFHYEADVGLSVGVSFRLDLWFTTVTMSVSVSVDLSLWGPSFGGEIEIDLSLISFTVSIGSPRPSKTIPIGWSDFKTSFLPASSGASHAAHVSGAPIVTDSYCHSAVASGLVTDLSTTKASPSDPDWIVDAETLQITTFTALPAKRASLTTAGNVTTALPAGNGRFGVGPVDVAIDHLDSAHGITVQKLRQGQADPNFHLLDHATVTPVLANVPTATWAGAVVVNPSVSQVNSTPTNIDGVVVGYTITAKRGTPDHTPLPIDMAVLEQESEGTVDFAWTTPDVSTTDPFDQATAMDTFSRSLVSAASTRLALLQALNATGLSLDIDTDTDIAALADKAAVTLLAAPILSYLGEERVH